MQSIRLACLLSSLLLTTVLSAQSPRGAWSGSNSYVVGDTVTYLGNNYIDIQATAPSTIYGPGNLFNSAAINFGGVINSDSGTLANFGGDFKASDYIPVPSGGSFVSNLAILVFSGSPNFGIAFYDSTKGYTSGNANGPNNIIAAGTAIAVPTGSSYVRFWYRTSYESVADSAAIVNAGSTLQTVYTGFGQPGPSTNIPAAAPTDTVHWSLVSSAAPATPLPYAGKKFFCLGDSILYLSGAGAACQSIATKLGGTLSSQGDTTGGIDAVFGRTFASFQNGQNHPLSAAVIADVDVMVILLGANQDSTAGLGSPSDAPGLGTSVSMSSQMKYMLQTILQWKPGIRIVVAGPYQSNHYNIQSGTDGLLGTQDSGHTVANDGSLLVLKNIDLAMKAVCELYGIPYIDMYTTSGVNFSTSTLWLGDGLHPNPLGYATFYVPTIANQLVRYAYQ